MAEEGDEDEGEEEDDGHEEEEEKPVREAKREMTKQEAAPEAHRGNVAGPEPAVASHLCWKSAR